MINLEKQKSKLEDTKRKIKQREKMLKEKEKMASQNVLIDLGKLFVKAQISHLDHDSLLGALIEISEKSKDEKNLLSWKEKSKQQIENDLKTNQGNPITIKFENPPAKEIKEQLRNMDFKWNRFRGEYYGFGEKTGLSNLLENQKCKIEIISNEFR